MNSAQHVAPLRAGLQGVDPGGGGINVILWVTRRVTVSLRQLGQVKLSPACAMGFPGRRSHEINSR